MSIHKPLSLSLLHITEKNIDPFSAIHQHLASTQPSSFIKEDNCAVHEFS
jgi:hypothetical protein